MLYTIYKVTNKLNGKIYIGKHQTANPNDGYYGSGKAIKAAIEKHGKENFIKEVLYIFETEIEMNFKEKELITEEFVSRSDTYNAGVGGEGGPHFKGKTHSEESLKKMREKQKGKIISEEQRKSSSEKQKGKIISEASKIKMSIAKKGTKLSQETKDKIKAARAKQVISDETRKKMSESAKNRKRNIIRGPVD